MPNRRCGSVHRQTKIVKAVVIARPVRSEQKHIGKEVRNRTAPGAAGRAKDQSVDNAQPGKIVVRRGHCGGRHIGVAPSTGGIDVQVDGSSIWA
jgi:hypothetical protein